MRKAWVIAVCALIPFVAQASGARDAGTYGFYAGGSIGQTKLKLTIPDGSGTGNEVGFKLLGGYRFNPYFGIEGAYYYPGSFSEAEDGASLKLRANIFQLSAVGTYPIAGPVSVFGRVGAARWDAKLTGCTDDSGCGSLTDDAVEFNWGVGIDTALTDNLSMRVEFEQTRINQPIVTLPAKWELRYTQLAFTYLF